jgi:hypothetical protein
MGEGHGKVRIRLTVLVARNKVCARRFSLPCSKRQDSEDAAEACDGQSVGDVSNAIARANAAVVIAELQENP